MLMPIGEDNSSSDSPMSCVQLPQPLAEVEHYGPKSGIATTRTALRPRNII